jgi:hypothetical protein
VALVHKAAEEKRITIFPILENNNNNNNNKYADVARWLPVESDDLDVYLNNSL